MKKIILFLLIAVTVFGQYKQSPYITYPSLVFREVFNDESTTRANGNPTLTAITYTNGAGIFNGSSSSLIYSNKINLVKKSALTIVVRYKKPSDSSIMTISYGTSTENRIVFSDYNNRITYCITSGTINGYGQSAQSTLSTNNYVTKAMVFNGTQSTDATKLKLYTNGVQESLTFPSGLGVSTTTLLSSALLEIGYEGWKSEYSSCSIDYLEIYNRALSASEIANLYSGVAFKDLDVKPFIDFDSRTGVIKDNTGKTITSSNVSIKRQGSFWASAFNNTTSYLSIPTVDLSGNITVCAWVKANSFGENVLGNILSNSKETLRINSTNSLVNFSRDGASTNASSATNSFALNKLVFIAVTSTSAGVTNIYLGDRNNPPTISGTANQSAGTPSASSTLYIGNSAAGDRTWNGTISKIRIENSILTQNQINQIWSSGKIE